MNNILIKSTGFVLEMLEGLFKDKITVSGTENIPLDRPVLFTANHFTRAETLFLPYICHKYTGKIARSLADGGLFKGKIGEFLSKTGTLATDDPSRDEIIVGDLITGESNWIIYPEGNMMKNKKVTFDNGKYFLHLKDKTRSIFTGSATLALESQLLREEMLVERDRMTCWKYFITDEKKIHPLPTTIVPVNITYYPIRPGENKLKGWLRKKKKGVLHPRMDEELEIEGNILAEANMHIHFGKPICVAEYIRSSKVLSDEEHKDLPRDKRHSVIINHYRHKLTTDFMGGVYNNLHVNLDHIFALTLFHFPKEEVHINELISRVYLNIKAIQRMPQYQLHSSLKIDVFKVLAGKEFPALKSIFDLAISEGIIIGGEGNEFLRVNRSAFEDEHEFHNIRQKNIMKMLVNDISLLDDVVKVVKTYADVPQEEIAQEIFNFLFQGDLENFDRDYEKYHSELSKPKAIGRPFFLKADNNKIGVVLSHGYKAAPEEIRQLAEYLHKNGCNVYGVRLHGHGTAPINLKHTAWQKWYDSYMRGVVALEQVCDKVVFAGFSTGGLMSLYTAAQQPTKCHGVISINAAAKLQDIRVRFVKVVNFWNEMLDKFSGKTGSLDYVEDTPENPHINHSINYIKGVAELGKLISKTNEALPKVFAPCMIIQSQNDPIVKPSSGKIIYNQIHAREKIYLEPDLDKHVIVRGEKNIENLVFAPILEFIRNICTK
jgi:esterase/lipase/1-acyl-sn-glycerol-3-phosphate acyltransferase